MTESDIRVRRRSRVIKSFSEFWTFCSGDISYDDLQNNTENAMDITRQRRNFKEKNRIERNTYSWNQKKKTVEYFGTHNA